VQWIGRAPLSISSLWDMPWFLGVVGNKTFLDLRTVEAEYIALSVAVCEVVWLHKLLADLSEHVLDSTVIHCDNQSYVKISDNLVFHEKSKHIEIKHHYIRDMV
jgi:hypothetical protein